MQLGAAGAARVTIDSSGKVGIGIASPTATLDVRRADASGKIAEFHQSAGFGLEFGSSQAQSYIEAGSNQTLLITVPSDMTIDSGGDIILDAAGNQINFKSGGTSRGYLDMSTGGLILRSLTSDADIILQGTDGSSAVNALTLDMSAAGAATFNAGVTTTDINLGTSTGQKFLMYANSNIKYGMSIETSEYRMFAEDQAVLTFGHMARSNGTTYTERFRISSDGSLSTPTLGTSNVRFGVNAGNSIASGGNYNVVVGDEAGTALTTGDGNVAVGFNALAQEDEHGLNVAIGNSALYTQNAGANAYNTAVGASAFCSNHRRSKYPYWWSCR